MFYLIDLKSLLRVWGVTKGGALSCQSGYMYQRCAVAAAKRELLLSPCHILEAA